MSRKRIYRTFSHREAVFRICCEGFEAVTAEIVRQRRILGEYISGHVEFGESLEPVAVGADAPEAARRMACAAALVGVGPMAAVAGAIAQLAGEAGLKAGAREAIVDNGGDIYISAGEAVVIGLDAGIAGLGKRAGFRLEPGDTPISVCSSSGLMGHSMSLGSCDLATVVAKDAALADAAATQAANLVTAIGDIDSALERIVGIEGVAGVLIVKADRVGLAGCLPALVKTR